MMDVSACNMFTENVFRRGFNFVLLRVTPAQLMASLIEEMNDGGLCVGED
jgi:hypothetical protein